MQGPHRASRNIRPCFAKLCALYPLVLKFGLTGAPFRSLPFERTPLLVGKRGHHCEPFYLKRDLQNTPPNEGHVCTSFGSASHVGIFWRASHVGFGVPENKTKQTTPTATRPVQKKQQRPSEAKVACHDMFKLLDRQSLIEGLEPSGATEEKLDAGTIEFQEAKGGGMGESNRETPVLFRELIVLPMPMWGCL